MLADAELFFPKSLPPGFSYLEGEPTFDARHHLALASPDRIYKLAEFGYSDEMIATFPSDIACTSPARLMTREGVDVLREVVRLHHADQQKRQGADWKIKGSMRAAVYRSRFIRDFSLAPEVTEFFSRLFGTPLVPHVQPHLLANQTFAVEADGRGANTASEKNQTGWHYDITALDYVMMVHDPKSVEGGLFSYFDGTREEGVSVLEATGEVPHNRIVQPHYPEAGYAVYMQGCALLHRGSPLLARVTAPPGYRSSFVNSYCARNVSTPDYNRTFFTTDDFGSGGSKVCRYTEFSRRKAWIARAKLGTLMEELPFTEDRAVIVEALKAAIADVHQAIDMLEGSDVTAEDSLRVRRQMPMLRYPG